MTAFPVPVTHPSRSARSRAAIAWLLSRLRDMPLLRWAGEAATRREERLLLAEIRRLEELSPHLLGDIGVRQVARDSYVMGEDSTDDAARHGAGRVR